MIKPLSGLRLVSLRTRRLLNTSYYVWPPCYDSRGKANFGLIRRTKLIYYKYHIAQNLLDVFLGLFVAPGTMYFSLIPPLRG